MKRLLVTGSKGFIGSKICELSQNEFDIIEESHYLVNYENEMSVQDFFQKNKPQYVIHAAGYNGNILFNSKYPVDIYTRNINMGCNVLSLSLYHRVKKVISLVASCAYPYEKEILFEKDFLSGVPHPSVEGHGYAKRHLQLLSHLYNKQYGLNACTCCLTTVYGPGDNMYLSRTKIMMSLIIKFLQAKRDHKTEVELLGTGSPRRQFIYINDGAKLVLECLKSYNDSNEPINLSDEQDISVKELAEKIAQTTGFTGIIKWQGDEYNGQNRKQLDNSKMLKMLPHQNFTSLDDGIKKTVLYAEKKLNETNWIFC